MTLGEKLAQARILLHDKLRDERIGHRVQPMQRGVDINIGAEAVIRDAQATIGGEARDFHRLGETAAAREIHLHDVHAALVHEVEE